MTVNILSSSLEVGLYTSKLRDTDTVEHPELVWIIGGLEKSEGGFNYSV